MEKKNEDSSGTDADSPKTNLSYANLNMALTQESQTCISEVVLKRKKKKKLKPFDNLDTAALTSFDTATYPQLGSWF